MNRRQWYGIVVFVALLVVSLVGSERRASGMGWLGWRGYGVTYWDGWTVGWRGPAFYCSPVVSWYSVACCDPCCTCCVCDPCYDWEVCCVDGAATVSASAAEPTAPPAKTAPPSILHEELGTAPPAQPENASEEPPALPDTMDSTPPDIESPPTLDGILDSSPPSDTSTTPGASDLGPGTGDLGMRHRSILNVLVPPDARVTVNDWPTKSSGHHRRYVAYGLEPGKGYTYRIRAEVLREGKQLVQSKEIALPTDHTGTVVFDFEADRRQERAGQPVKTTLIVRSPDDAKVFLAGKPTRLTGPVRRFSTTNLRGGRQWERYEIRAELVRDGHKMTERRLITLKAGQQHQVDLDFDTPRVAQATGR